MRRRTLPRCAATCLMSTQRALRQMACGPCSCSTVTAEELTQMLLTLNLAHEAGIECLVYFSVFQGEEQIIGVRDNTDRSLVAAG